VLRNIKVTTTQSSNRIPNPEPGGEPLLDPENPTPFSLEINARFDYSSDDPLARRFGELMRDLWEEERKESEG